MVQRCRIHGRACRGRSILAALAALAICSLATPLQAQRVIGRLLETGTAEPVAVGFVSLLTESGRLVASVTTDKAGRFVIVAPQPGRYFLEAEHLAYEAVSDGPFQVVKGRDVAIELEMEPKPIAVDGLDVAAEGRRRRQTKLEAVGFFERRAMSFGHFITREQVERRNAARVTELLQMVPSVRLESTGDPFTPFTPMIRGNRANRACLPRVFMDGVPVNYGIPPWGAPFDDLIRPWEVEGIEVYSTAEIPPQYLGTGAACGVILIWSRQPGTDHEEAEEEAEDDPEPEPEPDTIPALPPEPV